MRRSAKPLQRWSPETGIARPRLAMACDGRLSSPDIKAALIEGAMSAGAEVIDIGLGPTPMLYFAVQLSGGGWRHHGDGVA